MSRLILFVSGLSTGVHSISSFLKSAFTKVDTFFKNSSRFLLPIITLTFLLGDILLFMGKMTIAFIIIGLSVILGIVLAISKRKHLNEKLSKAGDALAEADVKLQQQLARIMFPAGIVLILSGAIAWIAIGFSVWSILLIQGIFLVLLVIPLFKNTTIKLKRNFSVRIFILLIADILASVLIGILLKQFVLTFLLNLVFLGAVLTLLLTFGVKFIPDEMGSSANTIGTFFDASFNLFAVGILIATIIASLFIPLQLLLEYSTGTYEGSTLVVQNPINTWLKSGALREFLSSGTPENSEFLKQFSETFSLNKPITIVIAPLSVIERFIWTNVLILPDVNNRSLGEINALEILVFLSLFLIVLLYHKSIIHTKLPEKIAKKMKLPEDLNIREQTMQKSFYGYSVAKSWKAIFEMLTKMTKKIEEITRAMKKALKEKKDASSYAKILKQKAEELKQMRANIVKSLMETSENIVLENISFLEQYAVSFSVMLLLAGFVSILLRSPYLFLVVGMTFISALIWIDIQNIGRRFYSFAIQVLPSSLLYIYTVIFVPEEASITPAWLVISGLFSLIIISAGIEFAFSMNQILLTLVLSWIILLVLKFVFEEFSTMAIITIITAQYVGIINSNFTSLLGKTLYEISISDAALLLLIMMVATFFFHLMAVIVVSFSLRSVATVLDWLPEKFSLDLTPHVEIETDIATEKEIEKAIEDLKEGKNLDKYYKVINGDITELYHKAADGTAKLISISNEELSKLNDVEEMNAKLYHLTTKENKLFKAIEKNGKTYIIDDEGHVIKTANSPLKKLGAAFFKEFKGKSSSIKLVGHAKIKEGEHVKFFGKGWTINLKRLIAGQGNTPFRENQFQNNILANFKNANSLNLDVNADFKSLLKANSEFALSSKDSNTVIGKMSKNGKTLSLSNLKDKIDIDFSKGAESDIEALLKGKALNVTLLNNKEFKVDLSSGKPTNLKELVTAFKTGKIKEITVGGKKAKIITTRKGFALRTEKGATIQLKDLEKLSRIKKSIHIPQNNRSLSAINLKKSRAALQFIKTLAGSNNFTKKTLKIGDEIIQITKTRDGSFVAIDSSGKEIARSKTMTGLMAQLKTLGKDIKNIQVLQKEQEAIAVDFTKENARDVLKNAGELKSNTHTTKTEKGEIDWGFMKDLYPSYDTRNSLRTNLQNLFGSLLDPQEISELEKIFEEIANKNEVLTVQFVRNESQINDKFKRYYKWLLNGQKQAILESLYLNNIPLLAINWAGNSKAYSKVIDGGQDIKKRGTGTSIIDAIRSLIKVIEPISPPLGKELADKLRKLINEAQTQSIQRGGIGTRPSESITISSFNAKETVNTSTNSIFNLVTIAWTNIKNKLMVKDVLLKIAGNPLKRQFENVYDEIYFLKKLENNRYGIFDRTGRLILSGAQEEIGAFVRGKINNWKIPYDAIPQQIEFVLKMMKKFSTESKMLGYAILTDKNGIISGYLFSKDNKVFYSKVVGKAASEWVEVKDISDLTHTTASLEVFEIVIPSCLKKSPKDLLEKVEQLQNRKNDGRFIIKKAGHRLGEIEWSHTTKKFTANGKIFDSAEGAMNEICGPHVKVII